MEEEHGEYDEVGQQGAHEQVEGVPIHVLHVDEAGEKDLETDFNHQTDAVVPDQEPMQPHPYLFHTFPL